MRGPTSLPRIACRIAGHHFHCRGRKALIGRDHDPYNWESATGECGKCVYARNALDAGSAVRPACLLAVRKVRTVERSVR